MPAGAESAGVALASAGLLDAADQLRKPRIRPQRLELWVDFHLSEPWLSLFEGLLERRESLVLFAELRVEDREVDRGDVGIFSRLLQELEGLAVERLHRRGIPGGREVPAQVLSRFVVARQGQVFLLLGDRLRIHTFASVDVREVSVHSGVLWIELDGLLVLVERLPVSTRPVEDGSERPVRLDGKRIEPLRHFSLRDRLVPARHPAQGLRIETPNDR